MAVFSGTAVYVVLLRPHLCAVRGWGDSLLARPACREAVHSKGKESVGASTAKSLVNSEATNISVFLMRFCVLKPCPGLGSSSWGWWLAVLCLGRAVLCRTVCGAGDVVSS